MMNRTVNIKKGLDIPLDGAPSLDQSVDSTTRIFAICPDDYPGWTWKSKVKVGDRVRLGDPLFADKDTGLVSLVSPVSGSVHEVCRGERRHILYISVLTEGNEAASFDVTALSDPRRVLCSSGLWAMMRQRPFDIVPDPNAVIRDIFVTSFDSSPLSSPLIPEIVDDHLRHLLDMGFKVLKQLTDGVVFLAARPGLQYELEGVETVIFQGPHPAGNPGTHIASLKPLNKGETVLTLDIVTVARIGYLFSTGRLDMSAKVAVTGSEAVVPHIINTTIGAKLSTLLERQIKNPSDTRIISGNVLTGVRCSLDDGFLHYPYRQVTLIPEGNTADEFMGWASLSPSRFSVKRSFPSWLLGRGKRFGFDARLKGGHRAMILSGEYDKVFPFDIFPEYLLRAFMAGDIDRMEELGAYEVAPEDFALAEFVDTSKQPLQKFVRQGLDLLRRELS